MKFLYRIEKNQKFDYLAKERDLRDQKNKTEKDEKETEDHKESIKNKNNNEIDSSSKNDECQNNRNKQNAKDNIQNKEKNTINEFAQVLENDQDELDKSIVDFSDIENVLQGFMIAGVKITLLSGNIDSHIKKKKYNNFFDLILLGFTSQNIFSNIPRITNKNSKIFIELNSYMTAFNDENKNEYKEKLKQLTSENGFVLEDTSLKHTWKFFYKSYSDEI
jgi:hypothetical protein